MAEYENKDCKSEDKFNSLKDESSEMSTSNVSAEEDDQVKTYDSSEQGIVRNEENSRAVIESNEDRDADDLQIIVKSSDDKAENEKELHSTEYDESKEERLKNVEPESKEKTSEISQEDKAENKKKELHSNKYVESKEERIKIVKPESKEKTYEKEKSQEDNAENEQELHSNKEEKIKYVKLGSEEKKSETKQPKEKTDVTVCDKKAPVGMKLVLMPTAGPSGMIQYMPVFVVPDQISADGKPDQAFSQQTVLSTGSQIKNLSAVSETKSSKTLKPQAMPVLIAPKQSNKSSLPGPQAGLAVQNSKTHSSVQRSDGSNTLQQIVLVTNQQEANNIGDSLDINKHKIIYRNTETGALYATQEVQKILSDGREALIKKVLENNSSTPKELEVQKQVAGETKQKQPMKQTTVSSAKQVETNIEAINPKKRKSELATSPSKKWPLKKKQTSKQINALSKVFQNNSANTDNSLIITKRANLTSEKSSNKKATNLQNIKPAINPENSSDEEHEIVPHYKDNSFSYSTINSYFKDLWHECVCCGKRVQLENLDTEEMHQKGFPDILHRYGGITVDEHVDKICKPCMHMVLKIDTKLIKFFEKCQKQAKKKTKQELPLTHIKRVLMKKDKATNTEFTALTSVPVSGRQVQNPVCKQTFSEQLVFLNANDPGKDKKNFLNNTTTLIPGHFILPKTPDIVKLTNQTGNIFNTVKQNTPVVSSRRNERPILPKLRDKLTADGSGNDNPSTVKLEKQDTIPEMPITKSENKTENSVQRLVQHEAVSIDHDYDQSVSDKQRNDLVKKVELEELKAKLYSDGKPNDTSAPKMIFKCCGQLISVCELSNQLLSFEEAINIFQIQELKNNSAMSTTLLARKHGPVSDLMKKCNNDDIKTYDFTKLFVEFCENFPFLVKFFLAITNIKAEKLEDYIPQFGMIYAMLMRMRMHDLNRVQRMVTKCLLENVAPKKVHEQLASVGVCLAYGTALVLQRNKNFTLNYSERLDQCALMTRGSRMCPEGSIRMERIRSHSEKLKQLASKVKVKNLKKTTLSGSPLVRKSQNLDESSGPSNEIMVEELPPPPKKRRRENKLIRCNEQNLTPSQHNYVHLDEKTGKLKLFRKKHLLSVKTCQHEQSVTAWSPDDLEKCQMKYTSDWVAYPPYMILEHLSKKCMIPPLTMEEESVLGDLNELIDLDIDVNAIDNDRAEKVIINLTKTIEILEESSAEITENETQTTQMLYECTIDWLRVILQMFIRQQSGLSTSREEEIRMVEAFARCFGFSKQFGEAVLRVFDTKVTSTPPLRLTKPCDNAINKVVAVVEVDGNQFPQDIINDGSQSGQENDMNQSNQSCNANQSEQDGDQSSQNGDQSNQNGGQSVKDGSEHPQFHDERLFERLAGEMLVEVPQALYQDCMFGLVFYKTSVVVTCLHILREHIRKLQMNLPLSAKHKATVVYSKLYDLLKSNERLEVMRFLARLSKGPNPAEMAAILKDQETMKTKKHLDSGGNEQTDQLNANSEGLVAQDVTSDYENSENTRQTTPVNARSRSQNSESVLVENQSGFDIEMINDLETETGNGISGEETNDVILLEEISGGEFENLEEIVLMDGVQEDDIEIQTAVNMLESEQQWGEILS